MYPIKVVCVIEQEEDKELTKTVKEHCETYNIPFNTRYFDSIRFREDCHNITSLPAYHIYVNSLYKDTFYPHTRPKALIRETIHEYTESLKKKEENALEWKNFFRRIIGKPPYKKPLRSEWY